MNLKLSEQKLQLSETESEMNVKLNLKLTVTNAIRNGYDIFCNLILNESEIKSELF